MNDQNPGSTSTGTIELFGRTLASGSAEALTAHLLSALETESPGVYFCNVHMLMLAREDAELAQAMDTAGLVLADGVPVAWLQRRLGEDEADVLRGYEAMQAICSDAAQRGLRIGLFGSTPQVLEALGDRLLRDHPGLKIALSQAPPRIETPIVVDGDLVRQINSLDLHCLFIGLGCPKQEKWVAAYGGRLDCSLLAVGAAFDWLAGTTPMPPRWMEKSGLGWLYRLLQNPRRMWYRYLKYNTKFIINTLLLLGRNRS